MKFVPQVDNGKLPQAPLNVINVPMFPSDTPFGNMYLKSVNLVRRIDRVNLEIARVYSTYVHPNDQDIENLLQDINEHQFYAEQVVYWFRKTADELIALAYLMNSWNRTARWPSSLQIDSIFGILEKLKTSDPSDNLCILFGPFRDFLFTLNEVSNAFKHSFINTDINVMGAEYPVVFALALKRNKLAEEPKFYSVSFEEMVITFSEFYQAVIRTGSQWATEQASRK